MRDTTVKPPCPICGRPIKKRKPLLLYDHPVCKKCYYGFANRRQAAFVVDWIGFQFLSVAVGMVFGVAMVTVGAAADTIDKAGTLLSWAIVPVFFCKDCFSGCSPGKALCGVRVIDATSGTPTGIGASIKRNLPLLIPFMPLIIAVTMGKGQRIGDGAANTKVVWGRYADLPVFTGEVVSAESAEPILEAVTTADPLPDNDNPYRPPVA